MSITPLNKKDKKLGKATKRRYDLPFQKDIGTNYMMSVIIMMVFLGVLSMALHLGMRALGDYWASGLEGKMTIEIPAESLDGGLRDQERLEDIAELMITRMNAFDDIETATQIPQHDIVDMVSPWLGEQITQTDIPLPILISLETVDNKTLTNDQITVLKNAVIGIDATSRLDTHKNWLDELVKMTGILRIVSIIMGIVITLTTLMAVAGVVRARLAAHMDDVELLHLMGATDHYISKQFKRHILGLAFKGATIGTGLGLLMIYIVFKLSSNLGFVLIPNYAFTAYEWSAILSVPLAIILLCFYTARKTLKNALVKMP